MAHNAQKAPEDVIIDNKTPSPPVATREPAIETNQKVTYLWTQRGIDELRSQGCFDQYGQPAVGSEVPEVLTSDVKKHMLLHGNCVVEQKAGSFSEASSFCTMTDSLADSSMFVMANQGKPICSVPEHSLDGEMEEQSDITPRHPPPANKADMGRLLLSMSFDNKAESQDVQKAEKLPENEEGGQWTIGWGVIGLMLLPLLL